MDAMATMDEPGTIPGDDCCNDAETFAKTGQACKSGQECSVGFQGLISFPITSSMPPISAAWFPIAAVFFRSFDPAALWRPPAHL